MINSVHSLLSSRTSHHRCECSAPSNITSEITQLLNQSGFTPDSISWSELNTPVSVCVCVCVCVCVSVCVCAGHYTGLHTNYLFIYFSLYHSRLFFSVLLFLTLLPVVKN